MSRLTEAIHVFTKERWTMNRCSTYNIKQSACSCEISPARPPDAYPANTLWVSFGRVLTSHEDTTSISGQGAFTYFNPVGHSVPSASCNRTPAAKVTDYKQRKSFTSTLTHNECLPAKLGRCPGFIATTTCDVPPVTHAHRMAPRPADKARTKHPSKPTQRG